MKKEYSTPTIISEQIAVGVFGSYGGGNSGGGHTGGGTFHPVAIIHPLFHVCCS